VGEEKRSVLFGNAASQQLVNLSLSRKESQRKRWQRKSEGRLKNVNMDSPCFPGSVRSMRSNLDLSSIPGTDISVIQSDFHTYFPVSTVRESSNPMEYIIPSSSTHYTDLANSFLYLTVKIVKADGSALSSTDVVAGSEDFFSALFDSVEISMNGTIVSKSASLYQYKSHILNMLSHGSSYKNTLLTSELFYADSKPDTFNVSTNEGFKKRMEFSASSASFEMIGKICESVWTGQTKYFPPSVEIRITLRRSEPSFALVGTTSATAVFPYKIQFDQAVLYVKRHIVHPSIVAQHQKLSKLQYPLRTFETRTFSIPASSQTVLSETLFRSKLPEFLIITFVDSLAITGKLDKSPFNFQAFKLQNIQATVDGDSSIYRSLDFDIDNKISLLGYNTLLTTVPNNPEEHGLSREDYLNGNFMICLDLNPRSGGNFQADRFGQVKLDLRFKTPLSNTITCIVLASFQGKLEIDSHKNVSLDSN